MGDRAIELAQSLLRLEINTIIKSEMVAEPTGDAFSLLTDLSLDYYDRLALLIAKVPSLFEESILDHDLAEILAGLKSLAKDEKPFFRRVGRLYTELTREEQSAFAFLLAGVLVEGEGWRPLLEPYLQEEQVARYRPGGQRLLKEAVSVLREHPDDDLQLDRLLLDAWSDDKAEELTVGDLTVLLSAERVGQRGWLQRFLLRELLHQLKQRQGLLRACFEELDRGRRTVKSVGDLVARFSSIVSLASLCTRTLTASDSKMALRIQRQSRMILGILEKYLTVDGRSLRERLSMAETISIQKAWDLGTEQVLMQTCISLAGDVTTRMSTSLRPEEKHGQAVQHLHQEAVQVSVGMWAQLLQVFKAIARQPVEALFGKTE